MDSNAATHSTPGADAAKQRGSGAKRKGKEPTTMTKKTSGLPSSLQRRKATLRSRAKIVENACHIFRQLDQQGAGRQRNRPAGEWRRRPTRRGEMSDASNRRSGRVPASRLVIGSSSIQSFAADSSTWRTPHGGAARRTDCRSRSAARSSLSSASNGSSGGAPPHSAACSRRFSRTVNSLLSPSRWPRYAMSARCSGSSAPTAIPLQVTVPAVGGARPASTRSRSFYRRHSDRQRARARGAKLEIELLE